MFPFSKASPAPTTEDPVAELSVDPEAGREAFTYVLHSGRTGIVHVEQVLEYNQDPTYLRDLLLYRLTLEAQKSWSHWCHGFCRPFLQMGASHAPGGR